MANAPNLRLTEIKRRDDNKPRIGTPDVLLKGDGLIILIEMKTRGLPSRHLYDIEQLVKYVNLARDERASWEKQSYDIVHVLLRPVLGGNMCLHRSRWFNAPETGGRVEMSREGIATVVEKSKWKVKHDHESALLDLDSLPVYERTYPELLRCLPELNDIAGQRAKAQLELVVADAEPRGEL